MKRTKRILPILLILLLTVSLILSSCDFLGSVSDINFITKIERTENDDGSECYTVHYADGTTSTLPITSSVDGENGADGTDGIDGEDGENGKDGVDGKDGTNGTNGKDGKDGKDLTIDEVYEKYCELYGDISYKDFLKEYLAISSSDNTKVISECLNSCMKVYSEFQVETTRYYGPYAQSSKSVSLMCGSAIIYKVESEYSYVLTNYHVVFYEDSSSSDKIANKIVGYLYGSEDSPYPTNEKADGYTVYDYGSYGIELEYVGGSIDYDIAVLKVKTADLYSVNPGAKAVTLADGYSVGETAIAIGNPENEGISVTQGIVSVDNEYITLAIDDTTRRYRSIRIDTSIYGGSSGGGLFNIYGELIGITNAGDTENQNINFAIPLEIAESVADNILRNYDGTNKSTVKKITLGISVSGNDSKYVYDGKGRGNIVETVVIASVSTSSVAANLGLMAQDTLTSIIINGEEIEINRYFQIGDLVLTVKAGDTLSFKYQRGGTACESTSYTVKASDLK